MSPGGRGPPCCCPRGVPQTREVGGRNDFIQRRLFTRSPHALGLAAACLLRVLRDKHDDLRLLCRSVFSPATLLFRFWCISSHESFVTCLSLREPQSFVRCVGRFFHAPLTNADPGSPPLRCSVFQWKEGYGDTERPLPVVWPQRPSARAAGPEDTGRPDGGGGRPPPHPPPAQPRRRPERLGVPPLNRPARASSTSPRDRHLPET